MGNLIISHVNFEYSSLLNEIKSEIEEITNLKVSFEKLEKDFDNFFNEERGQYDASKILKSFPSDSVNKTIIFTNVDIYIPIFTYVFGLAKLNGSSAIISSQRLSNIYYGLPENFEILKRRLLIETIHEFGHLSGLRHCENFNCVMASSTVVDEIDIKSENFCKKCSLLFSNICQT